MKTITKEQLFEKFGQDFSSTVTYKDGQTHKYKNPKHVNWKTVHKIRIDIPARTHINNKKDGELITRNGVSYLLTNG